jgi:hypothetical protein
MCIIFYFYYFLGGEYVPFAWIGFISFLTSVPVFALTLFFFFEIKEFYNGGKAKKFDRISSTINVFIFLALSIYVVYIILSTPQF